MKRIAQITTAFAFLATSLSAFVVVAAESVKARAAAPQVEVCFVLDTTGSMGNLIQGAKDKIWSIANELASAKPTPSIKFGLVAYRDRNDDYVTKVFNLTDDIDALYEHLMAFQAKGGNDTPESVNQALHDAVTLMKWSEGRKVLKLVFLVGDAPPHMDYPDDVKYPKVCELAMERSLIINTIQCGTLAATTVV
ncbi:MAG: vWA domain-containing protein, partial [Pirellulaceae bacterium]